MNKEYSVESAFQKFLDNSKLLSYISPEIRFQGPIMIFSFSCLVQKVFDHQVFLDTCVLTEK